MATVTYLGHSCFEVRTNGATIIIDPFLTGNPLAQAKAEDIRADYVLVTHGHGDHWGDTEQIAKQNGATVVGCFELATYAQGRGLNAHPLHIGGCHTFPFGCVKMTPALHGSGTGEAAEIYTGMAAGFLIKTEDKTIYHAGDTGLSAEMKLLGELESVDLAMLPIGDNFTMGIDDAVHAVNFVKPKTVVPMHYNTFELITADPEVFATKVREQTSAVPVVLNVGDSIEV